MTLLLWSTTLTLHLSIYSFSLSVTCGQWLPFGKCYIVMETWSHFKKETEHFVIVLCCRSVNHPSIHPHPYLHSGAPALLGDLVVFLDQWHKYNPSSVVWGCPLVFSQLDVSRLPHERAEVPLQALSGCLTQTTIQQLRLWDYATTIKIISSWLNYINLLRVSGTVWKVVGAKRGSEKGEVFILIEGREA